MSNPSTPSGQTLRVSRSDQLSPRERFALRTMLDAAYDGDFSAHDGAHAQGGVHVWIEGANGPISHASLVPRTLLIGGAAYRAGYVEAVATAETFRRQGHGTAVMRRINELIFEHYEIGALSTGEHEFYERLGWLRWRGPSFVMTAVGRSPTGATVMSGSETTP